MNQPPFKTVRSGLPNPRKPLVLALLLAAWGMACQDRTDRIRVEHKSPGKTPAVYEDGEVAGRVLFTAGATQVPAAGANILAVDTESSKLVLEHLQKQTDPSCLKRLTEMEAFLLESVQAGVRAGQQFPTATADADGYFLLPQVKPGAYLVIAYGRAGEIQAIWEQPAMVERYQAVVVKMVEPLISCGPGDESPKPPKLPPLPAASPPPSQP